MEFLTEHWLAVGVSVFWLSMVLYGHYRGLVRIAVTMLALVLSLVGTRIAMPCVTAAVSNHTAIHQALGHGLLQMAGAKWDLKEEMKETQLAYQREMIENLKLPEQMKKVLLENNNSKIYQTLGVDHFFDYLETYVADMILRTFGSAILFGLLFTLFRLLAHWLCLIAGLPILSELNQMAGALLGAIAGLAFVWLAALIVKACSGMPWTQPVLMQIEKSCWLSLLYQNNAFNWLFLHILSGFQ